MNWSKAKIIILKNIVVNVSPKNTLLGRTELDIVVSEAK
jgi:hypothetical protein